MPKKLWKRTDSRIFNGKKFNLWADHDPVSKTWAIGITRHWRRKGFHARMIKVKGGYVIFTRKKDITTSQSRSPKKSGGGPTHVRSHARRGTKGVRAHTRKR